MAKAVLLTKEEERILIRKAQSGDINARNELIERNILLCHKWISKIPLPAHVDRGDFLAPAMVGMIRAIEKFDFTVGTCFSTYAVIWIRQALQRYIENTYKMQHVPTHTLEVIARVNRVEEVFFTTYGRDPTTEELVKLTGCKEAEIRNAKLGDTTVISLDANNPSYDYGENEDSSLGGFITDENDRFEARVEREVWLSECLNEMKPEARELLERRYGLNNTPVITLVELGGTYSRTREGIRHRQVKAMRELKDIVEKKYGEEAEDILFA